MATVYFGLGSNINAEENLRLGISELRLRYGNLKMSPVYRSAPMGFDGDDFLNMVVSVVTDKTPQEINVQIDAIHGLAGRVKGSDRYVSRPLDIDLLLYGDQVIKAGQLRLPRKDVLEYSFVLRPLADLSPQFKHPETGRTMLQHWQAFDAAGHPIELVDVKL